MPNRIIREAILSSEKMALLGWPEEVFYRRLMSIVDDYGRYEANHQLLRSKCYPLQVDDVRVADITRWMAACQMAGLILIYVVHGKQYIEVLNFGQQQRTDSKYPACVSTEIICEQMPANAHLGVSVFGVVSEGVCVNAPEALPPPKKSRKKPTTPLPENFSVSERVKIWAKEKGFDRLDAHLESFVGKCKAKAYEYVDWDEGFMGAVREDWAKLRVAPRFQLAEPSVTVPSKPGIDPALAKAINDQLTCKGMPLEMRRPIRSLAQEAA